MSVHTCCDWLTSVTVHAHKLSVAIYAHNLPAKCKVLQVLNKLQLAMQLCHNASVSCRTSQLTATGTKVTKTQQHRLSTDPLQRHLMALMTLYLLSRNFTSVYMQTLMNIYTNKIIRYTLNFKQIYI